MLMRIVCKTDCLLKKLFTRYFESKRLFKGENNIGAKVYLDVNQAISFDHHLAIARLQGNHVILSGPIRDYLTRKQGRLFPWEFTNVRSSFLYSFQSASP